MKKKLLAVLLMITVATGAMANKLELNESQTVVRTGVAGGVELSNGKIHSGSLGIDYKDGSIYMQTNNDKNSVFNESGVGREKIGQFATVDTIGTEVTDALDRRLTVVENEDRVEVNVYEGDTDITFDGSTMTDEQLSKMSKTLTDEQLSKMKGDAGADGRNGIDGITTVVNEYDADRIDEDFTSELELRKAMGSEKSKREQADTVLEKSISDEVTARREEDVAQREMYASNLEHINTNSDESRAKDSELEADINKNKDKISYVNQKVVGNSAKIEVIKDDVTKNTEVNKGQNRVIGENAMAIVDTNNNLDTLGKTVSDAITKQDVVNDRQSMTNINHNSRINNNKQAILDNKQAISDASEIQSIIDEAQNEVIDDNSKKLSRVNGKVISNTAEIDVIRDEMGNISVESTNGWSTRVTDDEGNYSDVANASFASDNRTWINNHQERLNKHDEEIDANKDNIATNTKAIESEAEIRKIVDNNLAKGIDANSNLINGETIERTQADIRHDKAILENSHRISNLDSKIDGVESKMSKGVASAVATVHAMPLDLKKGEAGIGVGYGNFNGQSSIAFGVGVKPTENITVTGSLGASQGEHVEYTVGGGASYKFNLFN